MRGALARWLPSGSFARQVATLASGTALAQGLLVLASPLLTRLYTPADFGIFALYTSILGIISVVACWRYELAIVLPEKDEDAANLLALSLLITCGMSLFTLLLVALFRHPIAKMLGAPGLAGWLWLMPLSLLAAGAFQALNYWCTRRRQFARLAARQVTQSLVTVGSQLGAGFALHPGPGGMIGGQILGQVVATTRLGWQVGVNEKNIFILSINTKSIRKQANVHKKNPLYLTTGHLLNALSPQLPIFLLTIFFSSTVAGYFTLAMRILGLPSALVASSVAQVFYPIAAEQYNKNGNCKKVYSQTIKKLFIIGFVPFLVVGLVSPFVFGFVFGQKWYDAGKITAYLVPMFFLRFVGSPVSSLFMIAQKQNYDLVWQVWLCFSALLFIMIGVFFFKNYHATIILYSISYCISFIVNIYLSYKFACGKQNEIK